MSRTFRRILSYALFAALSGWIFLASSAAAGPDALVAERPSRGAGDVSPEVAQKAAAISRQTMSPFCPGRTLSDCPSGYATEWRRDIREMVSRGMSAGEIQAELEGRVRGNLSGIPNRETSYVVPVALALGAGFVLFMVFARLGRRELGKKPGSEEKKGSSPAATDERLQAELDQED